MTKINPEKFKKAWFSFEEIEHIQKSIDNYEKTGKWYSLKEVEEEIDNRIFAKAKSVNV